MAHRSEQQVVQAGDVRFGSLADMTASQRDVRLPPKVDIALFDHLIGSGDQRWRQSRHDLIATPLRIVDGLFILQLC